MGEDFIDMMALSHKTKKVEGTDRSAGFLKCSTNVFGDPIPGSKKQCFCEREKKPLGGVDNKTESVRYCASEGGNCQCQGRVFYGKEYDESKPATIDLDPIPQGGKTHNKQPELNFKEMIKFPFTEQKVFGNVSCSSDVFGNVARGYSKQCFCASEFADMKVDRCALERDHAECIGDGFVYYGKEAINGVNPAPFDSLLRDKYIKKAVHGSIACSNAGMGGDPAPGHAK